MCASHHQTAHTPSSVLSILSDISALFLPQEKPYTLHSIEYNKIFLEKSYRRRAEQIFTPWLKKAESDPVFSDQICFLRLLLHKLFVCLQMYKTG